MMKYLKHKYPLLSPDCTHDTLCANVIVFSGHTAAEYLAGMSVLKHYTPWIVKHREWKKHNKNNLDEKEKPSFFSPS